MKKIYFITGNQGKLTEIQNRVSSNDIEIIQHDIGYPEIQASTLQEVAIYGAQQVQLKLHQPFILEDAGIFIKELQGFPGVYSKFIYYSIGLFGVLQLMKSISNREAVFQCVYAYAEPNTTPQLFYGESKGIVSTAQHGTGGFGYDPIFIPKGSTKTFAEMTIDEKNKVSHRGKALDKLIEYLEKRNLIR